jgi:hypothetical protein
MIFKKFVPLQPDVVIWQHQAIWCQNTFLFQKIFFTHLRDVEALKKREKIFFVMCLLIAGRKGLKVKDFFSSSFI